jgi:hypothetical protein
MIWLLSVFQLVCFVCLYLGYKKLQLLHTLITSLAAAKELNDLSVKPLSIVREAAGQVFELYKGRNRFIRDRMWARIKKEGGEGKYLSYSSYKEDEPVKEFVR